MRNLIPIAIFLFFGIADASDAQEGYLLFRGNAQRTGEGNRKLPAWEKRPSWQRPLLKDKLDGVPDSTDPDDTAADLLANLRFGADPLILPGGFPIIVKDVCIYHTYRDFRSVPMQGIELKDEWGDVWRISAGSILWKGIAHDTSLGFLLEKPSTRISISKVVELLRAQKQERFLWANPTIGSVNSDGRDTFFVTDLAFPAIEFKPIIIPPVPSELKPLINGNELHAQYADNGKLRWDVFASQEPVFKDSHFLGAPLPLDGKVLVLNEREGELRLVTIDANKVDNGKPRIDSVLQLTVIPEAERILKSPLRRSQGLHIAAQGDLLVCPTHAGLLLGVDRAKKEVRWSYRYRDENTAPPTLQIWQAACPIISEDRIVYAAADAKEIHCLDLKGKKQWTAVDPDGLYVATVHKDIVLVVGKRNCRALKLTDGTEKWKLEVGLPAGVGVKDGATYFVPCQKDDVNKKAIIWAIDLAKGAKARAIDVPYPDAIGNLAHYRGMFVTQSATHVAAFSQ